MEELFEGTEQYVSRFIQELDNTVDEVAVKEAMTILYYILLVIVSQKEYK